MTQKEMVTLKPHAKVIYKNEDNQPFFVVVNYEGEVLVVRSSNIFAPNYYRWRKKRKPSSSAHLILQQTTLEKSAPKIGDIVCQSASQVEYLITDVCQRRCQQGFNIGHATAIQHARIICNNLSDWRKI